MTEQQINAFIAGFDLAGERLSNGKLKAYGYDELLDDWPDELTLFGKTFTREDTVYLANGYESAIYA